MQTVHPSWHRPQQDIYHNSHDRYTMDNSYNDNYHTYSSHHDRPNPRNSDVKSTRASSFEYNSNSITPLKSEKKPKKPKKIKKNNRTVVAGAERSHDPHSVKEAQTVRSQPEISHSTTKTTDGTQIDRPISTSLPSPQSITSGELTLPFQSDEVDFLNDISTDDRRSLSPKSKISEKFAERLANPGGFSPRSASSRSTLLMSPKHSPTPRAYSNYVAPIPLALENEKVVIQNVLLANKAEMKTKKSQETSRRPASSTATITFPNDGSFMQVFLLYPLMP